VIAGVVDDASFLSKTEGENAKFEKMLKQYFTSLAQSGPAELFQKRKT